MSEQPSNPPQIASAPLEAVQATQRVFRQSEHYRVVFSNFFKLRIGPGDLSIVFGAFADVAGNIQAIAMQDEVCVSMSWSQLKALSNALASAVEAIEKQVGPVPMSERGAPRNLDAIIKQTLAGFGFTAKS